MTYLLRLEIKSKAYAQSNGVSEPNLTDRVGFLDYVGFGIDGFGIAAERTAKETYKYGIRGINGSVISAVKLTSENAAIWGKIATRLNIAGGITGVVDCSMQSFDDFSNRNYILGTYEATKAASYTTGTLLLFSPFAPVGAGVLMVTGAIDIAGDLGMYIYGRKK